VLDAELLADTRHNTLKDLLLCLSVALLVTAPLAVLRVLVDAPWCLAHHLVGWLGTGGLFDESGLGADGSVDLDVELFHVLDLGSCQAL